MAGNKKYKDEELAKFFYVSVQLDEPLQLHYYKTEIVDYFTKPKEKLCYGCEIDKLLGKNVATASDIAIEAMVDEIQKLIANGKLKPEEVDILTFHGIDPKVVDRWRAKFGTAKTEKKSGLTCCKCNEFFPYADTPNQPDGSFKCFGCRH